MQTVTYMYNENGTSDKAVDGNYDNTDLQQCATMLDPRMTSSVHYTAKWEVDLEGLYAIVSVTIYNTAVLPGINYDCYCSYTGWAKKVSCCIAGCNFRQLWTNYRNSTVRKLTKFAHRSM